MLFENATGAPTQNCKGLQLLPETQPGNARLRALHAALRYRIARERNCRLWVSTDLVSQGMPGVELHPEDLIQGSKGFRLLSPDFFLWLEKRFEMFQKAMSGKALPPDARAFASRFAAVQKAARAFYSAGDFDEARNRLNDCPMESPNFGTCRVDFCDFKYPAGGNFRFAHSVTHHAIGETDAIRDSALALGWTEAELFQTRGHFAFPCGGDYGVVCFIHADHRLGQVTAKSIELLCKNGHALHFYRRTVA